MGRYWSLQQFDQDDYEKLLRESLWSYEEALGFAANFILETEGAYALDNWKGRIREECQRLDKKVFDWCNANELIPFSQGGRHAPPLLEEQWKRQEAIFDHDGELVDHYIAVDATSTYFRRDQFLKCLSSLGIPVIDEFDSPVNPKAKREMDLRSSTKVKLVCQGIAIALWDNNSKLTIPEVANHPLICEIGKGSLYSEKARREWLSEVESRPEHTKKPRKTKT